MRGRSTKQEHEDGCSCLLLLLLLRYRPAVDNHNLAIHEAIAFADHERRILSKLLWFAQPSGRCPEVVHLQKSFRQRLGQVRIKNTGGDRIHLHSEGARLSRKALGKSNHSRFRRRVMH